MKMSACFVFLVVLDCKLISSISTEEVRLISIRFVAVGTARVKHLRKCAFILQYILAMVFFFLSSRKLTMTFINSVLSCFAIVGNETIHPTTLCLAFSFQTLLHNQHGQTPDSSSILRWMRYVISPCVECALVSYE